MLGFRSYGRFLNTWCDGLSYCGISICSNKSIMLAYSSNCSTSEEWIGFGQPVMEKPLTHSTAIKLAPQIMTQLSSCSVTHTMAATTKD